MIANVEQADKTFKEEDRQPECGIDFCETCGDCLECYGEDDCTDGGHYWVIYNESVQSTDDVRH